MSADTAVGTGHSLACLMTNCCRIGISPYPVHCCCHLCLGCHLKMILEGSCIGSLAPSLLLLCQRISGSSRQSSIIYLDRMTQSVDCLLFMALRGMTLGTSTLLCIRVGIVCLQHSQLS